MAFGDLIGTAFKANTTSITNPFSTSSGSATVAVNDLVIAVVSQQANLTTTAMADNLGNTYTAQNAGTDPGTPTGIAFYSIVTVAGSITALSATCTASANNATIVGAAFAGPFSAIDANPANTSNDTTSPYDCPATGTLAQAIELVVGWISINNTVFADWSATAPNVLIVEDNDTVSASGALIGAQVTSSTSSVAPSFVNTLDAPGGSVLGTMSFKKSAASSGLFRAALLNGLGSGGPMITNPLG